MFKLGIAFHNNIDHVGVLIYGGIAVCTITLLVINFIK